MNVITYTHHGTMVSVRSDLQGKHREYCLCFSCEKFNPGKPETNCPIANLLYAVCLAHGVVTPVWECPQFVEVKFPEIKSLIRDVVAHAAKDTREKHAGLVPPPDIFKEELVKEECGVKDYIEESIKYSRNIPGKERSETEVTLDEEECSGEDCGCHGEKSP